MVYCRAARESDDSVLSEKIKNLTHHQIAGSKAKPGLNIWEESFKEVMQLFTSGVKLPDHFTTQ